MDAKKEAERQIALLERGAEELIPRGELLAKLERSIETGEPLRVKLGIDPTSNAVHLGHMVLYGKLRQFQDLGHRAVLIIGDYTASIGDPTGRNAERPALTMEQVRENAAGYTEQIFRIVDREKAEVRWQSEWYESLPLSETLRLAGAFSLAQLLAHETFRARYEQGVRVGVHELFYPVLQAWDSVVVGADVELGGTDQKFNILAGRDLQRDRGMEIQCAMLMPLLPGLDGRKMSKSFGNDIPILLDSAEQFARLMSVSDECMEPYRRLVLLDSSEDCEEGAARIASGENPMRLKLELAERIVGRFSGDAEAARSRAEWERRFSRKEMPTDIPVFRCAESLDICSILKLSGLTASASEARRLVFEGAVYVGDKRISDPGLRIDAAAAESAGAVVRIGRRRFVRVVFASAIEAERPD